MFTAKGEEEKQPQLKKEGLTRDIKKEGLTRDRVEMRSSDGFQQMYQSIHGQGQQSLNHHHHPQTIIINHNYNVSVNVMSSH